MDNQKNPTPQDDNWFDNLLSKPTTGADIGPDEQAVSAAGLTHPADAEVDRIIHETKAMDNANNNTDPQDGPFRDEEYRQAFGEGGGLEAMFEHPHDPADFEQEADVSFEEAAEAPVRKARPRKKKGYGLFGIPHLLATVIWIAIAVVIGVSLGRMLWVCAADVLAFGKEDITYTITITESDNIDTIATKLKNGGLIRYPGLFKIYASLTDAQEDISAGTFTLRGIYDYHALVNFMTPHAATREEVEVMIPEGYTCAQIFELLEEKNVCSAQELKEYAANGKLGDYWFLNGIIRGNENCLEGYLFPDTYRFYSNDTPSRVIHKMLDNFDYRFTDVMKAKLDTLNSRLAKALSKRGFNQSYIDAHKMTYRDIVIVASMIEKETANDSESYDISSVIYNRLTNPGSFPFLNIDATIIYALGGNIDPVTGKTKPLTSNDLQLDSPYNTYTRTGLVPGPISNPGRNSLNAALDPNETSFYYYVYNPKTAIHIFASSEREHQNNVNYVNSLK